MPMSPRKASWNSLTTCSPQVGRPSGHTIHLFFSKATAIALIIISLGIVPALFPDDEKESVLNQLREEALSMGAGPSKESLWNYFVNKSANNLHIVLAMSPVGDTLRTRCRNFPGEMRCYGSLGFVTISGFLSITMYLFLSGLMNNTVIDWFLPWPPQALLAVAQSFLGV